MSRAVLSLVLVAVATVALVHAQAQCYIAYATNQGNPDAPGPAYVMSITLASNGKVMAGQPWATGLNASCVAFINSSTIVQTIYTNLNDVSFQTSGFTSAIIPQSAHLYNVDAKMAGESFQTHIHERDQSDSPLSSGPTKHTGTYMIATTLGEIFWVNTGGIVAPYLLLTYSPGTFMPTEVMSFNPSGIEGFMLLSGASTLRMIGRSYTGTGWVATFNENRNVVLNMTFEGDIPIPWGDGQCRAFVIDDVTGETQFMCEDNGKVWIQVASNLTDNVILKLAYTFSETLNWVDAYNDGSQWYLLTSSVSGKTHNLYINTLQNDFTNPKSYGPFQIPTAGFQINMGALSCWTN